MRVAEELRAATDGLRNGAQKASNFVKQGLHEEAKAAFDGASSAAKSVVSGLFHLIPLPGSPEAHHTKHFTKTHWKTKTKTHTVSAMREVEKTKYKYVTVTATSSVTKTTVATTTTTASTTKTRMTTSTRITRTTEPKTKTVTTISTTSTTTQLVYGMPTNKPQPTAHCESSLGSCSIFGPNQPTDSHCACSLGSCSIVPDVPAGWTQIQGTRKPTPTPKPRPASRCDLHPWHQSDCPWCRSVVPDVPPGWTPIEGTRKPARTPVARSWSAKEQRLSSNYTCSKVFVTTFCIVFGNLRTLACFSCSVVGCVLVW
jgi:hypothetical protein